MTLCKITNPRTSKQRVDIKLNNRTIVLVAPGEATDMDLTGDQVGYLRGMYEFLDIKVPGENAKPPKGSKLANMLEADPAYAGPIPYEQRKGDA